MFGRTRSDAPTRRHFLKWAAAAPAWCGACARSGSGDRGPLSCAASHLEIQPCHAKPYSANQVETDLADRGFESRFELAFLPRSGGRPDARRTIRVFYSKVDLDHSLPGILAEYLTGQRLIDYISSEYAFLDELPEVEAQPSQRRPVLSPARPGSSTLPVPGQFDQTHPTHVQIVAFLTKHILERFSSAKFRDPLFHPPFINVVLTRRTGIINKLPTHHSLGGTTILQDFIEVLSALHGIQAYRTIAHEMFHRIQYAYVSEVSNMDCGKGDDYLNFVEAIREGGAEHMEGALIDDMSKVLGSKLALLDDRPLPLADYRDHFNDERHASYDASLFWQYFSSQHGQGTTSSAKAFSIQRLILESVNAHARESPFGIHTLRRAREATGDIGHFDRLLQLSPDGSETLCAETTWGNFVVAMALNGTSGTDSRFRLFNSAEMAKPLLERRLAIPPGRTVDFAALPEHPPNDGAENARIRRPGFGVEFGPENWAGLRGFTANLEFFGIKHKLAERHTVMLQPFSVRAYAVRIPPRRAFPRPTNLSSLTDMDMTSHMLRIEFDAVCGLEDALVQIVELDGSGRLLDLHRHDCQPVPPSSPYLPPFRTPPLRPAVPLDHTIDVSFARTVLVLVASRERRGDYRLAFRKMRYCPLIKASVMNARPTDRAFSSFSADPETILYNWRSPSLNILSAKSFELIIDNFGDTDADPVHVCLYYSDIRDGDLLLGWNLLKSVTVDKPIAPRHQLERDYTGSTPSKTIVSVTDVSLPPGRIDSRNGWLLKAVIDAPRDPNRRGKTILSVAGAALPGRFPEWNIAP